MSLWISFNRNLKNGAQGDSSIGQHGRWLDVKCETLQQHRDTTHSTWKEDKRARKRHVLQECKIRKTKGHYSIYIHTKKLSKLFQEQEKWLLKTDVWNSLKIHFTSTKKYSGTNTQGEEDKGWKCASPFAAEREQHDNGKHNEHRLLTF